MVGGRWGQVERVLIEDVEDWRVERGLVAVGGVVLGPGWGEAGMGRAVVYVGEGCDGVCVDGGGALAGGGGAGEGCECYGAGDGG